MRERAQAQRGIALKFLSAAALEEGRLLFRSIFNKRKSTLQSPSGRRLSRKASGPGTPAAQTQVPKRLPRLPPLERAGAFCGPRTSAWSGPSSPPAHPSLRERNNSSQAAARTRLAPSLPPEPHFLRGRVQRHFRGGASGAGPARGEGRPGPRRLTRAAAAEPSA